MQHARIPKLFDCVLFILARVFTNVYTFHIVFQGFLALCATHPRLFIEFMVALGRPLECVFSLHLFFTFSARAERRKGKGKIDAFFRSRAVRISEMP